MKEKNTNDRKEIPKQIVWNTSSNCT